MARRQKHFKLENAYFAVDAIDFVITPGEVVRMRIQGKLIMGCLDLWAIIYYLNYGREPISYKVLMQHLQCSKGYLRKMIKSLEDSGFLRIEEYQGKLLYRLISKQIIGSPDEPSGLCSEPPSLSSEPSGLCSVPPSLPDEPLQSTTRTASSSNRGGEIKIHEKAERFLRDAPEPREALNTAAQRACTAPPADSHIYIESESKQATPRAELPDNLRLATQQIRSIREILEARAGRLPAQGYRRFR